MHPVSEHRPRQDEERELLAAVVDHVGPLMVLEPDGKIVRFNRAAARLTGRDAAEAVGRNLFESGLIPAEQLAEVHRAFTVTKAEGRQERVLIWYETPDGRRLIGWRGTAIAGEDGLVHHVVVEGLVRLGEVEALDDDVEDAAEIDADN